MINITQGNDFALKIGFTKDGEKYEFDKVNGVLMVSRLGKKHQAVVAKKKDGYLYVTVAGTTPAGIYGIEVTGIEGEQARRTMFERCVEITYETRKGDNPVALTADIYDIGMSVELVDWNEAMVEPEPKESVVTIGDFILMADEDKDPETTYYVKKHAEDERNVAVFHGNKLCVGLTMDEMMDSPVTFEDSEAHDRCMKMYGLTDNDTLTYRCMMGTETGQVDELASNTMESFNEARFMHPALWQAVSDRGVLKNSHYLRSIVIPDSVTSIGISAFDNCHALQSVVIPDSVTSIGISAFNNCHILQSVVIPDSVTSIGISAFCNCHALQSVVIPDGVTSIEEAAFYNCYALQSVVIPDGVTSIEKGAFYNCNALQSVVIPDSVTSIGISAFDHCSVLQVMLKTAGVCPSLGILAAKKVKVWEHLMEDYKASATWKQYNIAGIPDVAPTCIEIEGKDALKGKTVQIGFAFVPAYAYRDEAVEWSVKAGDDYAEINSATGLLDIKEGAMEAEVSIGLRIGELTAEKTVKVTYAEKYIDVNTGEWTDSGKRSEDGYTIYQSDSSYQKPGGMSLCKVDIFGYTKVVIMARSNGQKYYDFLTVGDLDKTPDTKGLSVNANTKATFYSKASATSFTRIEYADIDKGAHTISLLYAKDNYNDNNEDRAFFYIKEDECA